MAMDTLVAAQHAQNGKYPDWKLLQQTNQRIDQLALRLERLQTTLDLWTETPDAMQLSTAAPAHPTSSVPRLLLSALLLIVGAAAWMMNQYDFTNISKRLPHPWLTQSPAATQPAQHFPIVTPSRLVMEDHNPQAPLFQQSVVARESHTALLPTGN